MEDVIQPEMRPKVIMILGPTASGKSKLAVEIGSSLKSIVISADSLQVYTDFGVVSDKIKSVEMNGVPHYGIDIVAPQCEFNVGHFLDYAIPLIESEIAKGKSPIIVGGTNMYIDKLLFTSRIDEDKPTVPCFSTIPLVSGISNYEYLEEIDPEMAARVHPNDLRRVSRAIAYFHETGIPMSSTLRSQRRTLRWSNTILLMKESASADLESLVLERVQNKMLKSGGLREELERIREYVSAGKMHWNKGLLQAIGYREFEEFIAKKIESGQSDEGLFDEGVSHMVRNTVRYAKKQKKWIKKLESYVELTHVSESLTVDDIVAIVRRAGDLRVKCLPSW